MPRQSELSKIAQALGKDEEEVLTEALVSAGSIDGAAEILSQKAGKPIWPSTIQGELRNRNLRFTRITTGRVEKVTQQP